MFDFILVKKIYNQVILKYIKQKQLKTLNNWVVHSLQPFGCFHSMQHMSASEKKRAWIRFNCKESLSSQRKFLKAFKSKLQFISNTNVFVLPSLFSFLVNFKCLKKKLENFDAARIKRVRTFFRVTLSRKASSLYLKSPCFYLNCSLTWVSHCKFRFFFPTFFSQKLSHRKKKRKINEILP